MRVLFFIIYFISFNCFGQFTNIPDANFEKALIELGYDNGNPDGKIPTNSISSIKSLNISFKKISNLKGLEDFINLERLICSGNLIKKVDLSNNANLRQLLFNNNKLTSLNLYFNTSLTYLDCSNNKNSIRK